MSVVKLVKLFYVKLYDYKMTLIDGMCKSS